MAWDLTNENENMVGGDFEPIPVGEYTLQIEDAEEKPTKTGGMGVKMTYVVLAPSHEGRKVFDFINTENASAKSAAIGRGQLKALALALGHQNLSHITTDDLRGGVFNCWLKQKTEVYQGETKTENELDYKSLADLNGGKGGETKAAAPRAATTAKPAAKAAGSRRPWEKKD